MGSREGGLVPNARITCQGTNTPLPPGKYVQNCSYSPTGSDTGSEPDPFVTRPRLALGIGSETHYEISDEARSSKFLPFLQIELESA